MLKQIVELAAQLFSLTKDVQQNKADVKDVEQEVKDLRRDFNDLRREVRDLATAVQRLAYEIHRVSENDNNERKLLALQLENTLLKFERRLPSGKPASEDKENWVSVRCSSAPLKQVGSKEVPTC